MKIAGYEIQVPFVRTSADTIKTILELAACNDDTKMVDLGSGDGRVVLAFAKNHIQSFGFEKDELLVKQARTKADELHLSHYAHFSTQDFWTIDISQFNVIYIYGMQSIMGRIEEKIKKEAKPGTKIITNIFRLPLLREKKTRDFVHLYIV